MFRTHVVACCLLFGVSQVHAQTVVKLIHKAPAKDGNAYLLTDGRVLLQSITAPSDFMILTPDNTGSYVNGSFSSAARLPAGYAPAGFAAAVLADGRVVL